MVPSSDRPRRARGLKPRGARDRGLVYVAEIVFQLIVESGVLPIGVE